MRREPERERIVALDIGTSKVVVLVAEVNELDELEVIGVGKHASDGLKKGMVVNIDATVHSIQRAVAEAELMLDARIHSVFTGIAGSHIKSLNSHGIVAIRDGEVDADDVERVMEAAGAVALPAEMKTLHVLPQEFIVDDHEGVSDPIGMAGTRLEARVHMVTGAVSAAQNIVKCVERCGLREEDMVLQPLASSHAVLTDEERELGVCLVDIGGGTTDLAIFTHGAIRHTAVIPVAGDYVTNDIAVALRTSTHHAEALKLAEAGLFPSRIRPEATVEVVRVGDKQVQVVPKQHLAEVVGARYEEIFSLVRDELRKSGLAGMIPAGVVLTGGSSQVPGACEMAREVLGTAVRLGLPQGITGYGDVIDSPVYATGVGLLLHGRRNRPQAPQGLSAEGGMLALWKRMKSWFQGNF